MILPDVDAVAARYHAMQANETKEGDEAGAVKEFNALDDTEKDHLRDTVKAMYRAIESAAHVG